MKIAGTTLGLICVLGAAAVGCSNQDTRSVDAETALGAFNNPTGTFSKDTGSAAFSGYQSEQAESSKVSRPGAAGSGTSRTQSLRILTRTLDAKAQCLEGEACACEVSGSFVYAMQKTEKGDAIHLQFDKCVSKDASGFDGEAILLTTTKPLLGLPAKPRSTKTSTALPEAQNILFAAKGTASEGAQSLTLEFALVLEAGYTLLAVEVPDGKIVVGLAANGAAFVKAKQGSFTCKPNGTKGYACTSTESGDKLEVAANAPASTAATAAEDDGETGGELEDEEEGDAPKTPGSKG